MPLAAQTVTAALVARLVAANVAGARVYSDHPHPFDPSELPAIRVEMQEEPAERVMLSTSVHEHRGRVLISGYVRATDDIDAALNILVSAALTALFAAPLPYGLEIDGEVLRDSVREGQADLMRVQLPLRALYFVAASAPETILSS